MAVTLKIKGAEPFLGQDELACMEPMALAAAQILKEKRGPGSDFLGWLDLPVDYDREEFDRIQKAAKKIQGMCQVLVVIGIGGSYLGARAAIEFIQSPFYNQKAKNTPDIYFVGNNASPSYLADILEMMGDRDFAINVISKSGSTTESAIAFRIFKKKIEEKYGKEGAKERIFATTDKAKGALKSLCDREGYETFVIPDDVGGRFSVLTAVGLLPMAVAGIDIAQTMQGAADARAAYANEDPASNDCLRYAMVRNCFLRKGKAMEVYAAYEPGLAMFGEWLKQLYAESEGKDQKGMFPVSVNFTTDLHSVGQFIQDGSRNMLETVLWVQKPKAEIFIEEDPDNIDGLNFLAGESVHTVNTRAYQGTYLAHIDGGTPNLVLEIGEADAYHFGWLVYFFEKACGISGYLLGVNPFNQPGVESYKKNMFALLGKPGYEERQAELLAHLD
jgi:glucose-6-phosphate isomerase